MKFILLSEHPDIHSSKRLVEEAQNANMETQIVNPYQKSLTIGHDQMPAAFSDHLIMHRTTGIHHGDYDLRISIDFSNRGASVVNHPQAFSNIRNKELQAIFFHSKQIPTIPTYSFRGRPDHNTIDDIKQFFGDFLVDNQFVLKTTRGNQGVGVNLIRGDKSLHSILETLWAIRDQKFIIQPYLEDGEEYRILISNHQLLGALKRKPGIDDFRSNSARGEAILLKENEVPSTILSLAHKSFDKSGALYAGIDLLYWRGYTLIIELNLVPGFKQMEQLTAKNLSKVIVHHALEQARRK